MVAAITAYGVGLFIHVMAVILTFGPTFGYGFFYSVIPQHPRSAPALIAGQTKVDTYLVGPGLVVVLLAGIYLMSEGSWDASETWITVGFVAILALFGLQHGYFRPQSRRLLAIAERDLESGDTLSDDFVALSERLGKVGAVAGLIVAIAVFFMIVKP